MLVLCLGFGGYKLATRERTSPEPAPDQTAGSDAAHETTAAPDTNSTPETAEIEAVPPSPADIPAAAAANAPIAAETEPPPENPAPPRISLQELTEKYTLEGVARGAMGSMVIFNQTPLLEGESLGELTVTKILQDHIEVTYMGNSYRLRAEVF